MSDGARKIVLGKPGDRFTIPSGYQGSWKNAVGIPLDGRHGPRVDLPGGNGDSKITIVARPDFRSEGKNSRVFK